MSWNGSGLFVRLYSWAADKAAGLNITASRMDSDTNDIVSGLNNCLTKDGQNVPTANLPLATFRHTNVGAAVARTDYARTDQVQDGSTVYAATSGTDTYTASLSPAIAAYATGAVYHLTFANPNTSTTPTININSAGQKTIVRPDGTALVAGDLNGAHVLRYDGTNVRVLTPKKVSTGDLTIGRGLQNGGSATGNLDVSELVNAQTGTTYTVVTGDGGKLLTFTNAAAIAVTLPQATSTPGNFPTGWFADFSCLSSSTGAVTITPTTSTIGGGTTFVLTPGQSARVVSDGTNYHVIRGVDNFSRNFAHFREEKANNTASADSSLTSGSYVKRTLDTTKANTISGCSLATSQVTLPAGTYYIEATAPVNGGTNSVASRLRIRDTTTPTTVLAGPNVIAVTNATNAAGFVTISGRFTLSAQKVCELDHWVSTTGCNGGTASNSGEVEVYAELFIWKIG